MSKLQAVLFDLDGTLIDTAPDLCGTLRDMQGDRGMDLTPFASMEHLASGGARALLGIGFGVKPEDAEFQPLRAEFLERYRARIAHESRCYVGIGPLLNEIEQRGMAWGVVTNKPFYLAEDLMAKLDLLDRCAVLVGGDTAAKPKPSPLPCLLAAERLGVGSSACIMIGDDERDIVSGRDAGMLTAAVRYGYIASQIEDWNADLVFDQPLDIQRWLEKS